MANIILCHGFNVKDAGKATLGRLKPYLREHHIQDGGYGDFKMLGVRFFNDNIATVVAGMANDNSIGIGHSNGCAILRRAAFHTPNIKQLILINPALDNDLEFPDTVERIDVYHNKYDDIVTVSKWLPFMEWGDMGNVGYTGNSNRVFNHETNLMFSAQGHSEVLNNTPMLLSKHIKQRLIRK